LHIQAACDLYYFHVLRKVEDEVRKDHSQCRDSILYRLVLVYF
jgi:hypothetical protein